MSYTVVFSMPCTAPIKTCKELYTFVVHDSYKGLQRTVHILLFRFPKCFLTIFTSV